MSSKFKYIRPKISCQIFGLTTDIGVTGSSPEDALAIFSVAGALKALTPHGSAMPVKENQ